MKNSPHLPDGDLRYDSPINLDHQNHSHSELYGMLMAVLKPLSNVLEIGCATGRMGELIKQGGHRVTGIELNPVSAAQAQQRLDEVFQGSVEEFLAQRELRQFDAVLMGDVLEHLPEPEATLKSLATNLGNNACLVLSVPNVAHGALRAALLAGHWEYSSVGLLDVTHLHFFTYRSILQTLQRAGWSVEAVGATYQNPRMVNQHYQLGASTLALNVVTALVQAEESEVFQILVRARPSNPERQLVHEKLLQQGRVAHPLSLILRRRVRKAFARIQLAIQAICGFTLK